MRTSMWAACGLAMALFGAVASTVGGCKSSDDSAPRRTSRKGEACMSSDDCSAGLSCIPAPGGSGGVCVTGEFKIAQTARECAIIQCQTGADCCPTPSTLCPQLLISCADGGGSSSACQQYNALCKCDVGRYDCVEGRCKSRCQSDPECGGSLKCAGGKCVECVDDSACVAGSTCQNGSCLAPCQTDGDCPAFNRCSAGKCVEGGCQTDRECVAATRNVEATCGTDQKCIIPCQTDLECGNPKAYSFYSCINRQCVYVGCANDKDCLLYYAGTSDAGIGTANGKTHVVCRDKATSNQ